MELPTYVQIEPAGQCNLRCQMCAVRFRRAGPPYGPPAFMAWDLFTRLVDELGEMAEGPVGPVNLHLQGLGEPTLHPRFFDMVRYAAERGMRVTTNSNLAAPHGWEDGQAAERWVTSGLDTLHVSVDGATARTYERIRVNAQFRHLLGNLEALLAARERLGSTRPHLCAVAVVMRQNLHELPALVAFARRWSMEGLFVQHLCHDYGEPGLPEQYRPMRDFVAAQTLVGLAGEDAQRIEPAFEAARRTAEAIGLPLRLPRTRPRPHAPGTPGRQRCDWPWRGAYVTYQGDAMPCCMASTPDRAYLGNVAQQGLAAVWNGPAYRAFREQLDSDRPPQICRSCSLYWGTF